MLTVTIANIFWALLSTKYSAMYCSCTTWSNFPNNHHTVGTITSSKSRLRKVKNPIKLTADRKQGRYLGPSLTTKCSLLYVYLSTLSMTQVLHSTVIVSFHGNKSLSMTWLNFLLWYSKYLAHNKLMKYACWANVYLVKNLPFVN